MTKVDTSLYERLGGETAVDAVVQEFYRRVHEDAALAKLFADVSMPRQRRMLAAFVTEAAGGPPVYRGRDVVEAHADVRITANRMKKVIGHLTDAMVELDVDQALIDETLATVAPVADAIVAATKSGGKGRASTATKSAAKGSGTTTTTTTTTTSSKAGTRSRSTSRSSSNGPSNTSEARPSGRAKADTNKENSMASTNGRTAATVTDHHLLDDASSVLAILEQQQANILVADTNLDLVYVNEGALKTLKGMEPQLQSHFGVSVDELLGGSIHRFHKNPQQVEARLAARGDMPLDVDFKFADRIVTTRINEFTDGSGDVTGYVVVFEDHTDKARELAEFRGQVVAIGRSQAVIEFELDGTIIDANENFCSTVGYSRDEIVGQHHRIFAEPEYAASPEYAAFWEKLGRGEFDSGEYKRVGKGGKEIWIQASYNPILDDDGNPFKVIKYATDITEAKLRNADFQGQLEAIGKSQAVISFELDGTIIDANDNFCNALGYSRDEIVGQHHRIFAEPEYAASPEYAAFWEKLGRGEFDAGEYKRLGKGGTEIWIQASYNPIMDASGRPFKVVKYATDVTDQVKAKQRLENGVNEILGVVSAAADGDLTGDIQTEGDDAIGQMGVGVAKLLNDLRESIASIGKNSEALAAAAEELQVVSEQMGANAAETSSQVSLVSEGSVEVSQNIETVSTGAEEMSASIKEIAKNASDAAKVAEQAVDAATSTNSTVEKLGESSAEIGQIVKVITGIAQQTNLLALNATIEAARAGEAGKGFAVVANEVKELAKETAKATEDISQKIEMIQGDTGRSVDAISEIAGIINQISEYQTTIASAVEEQAATTSDIARSVTDASRGSTEITSNMQAVASAAESTSSGAADSQRAATELAQMAAELQSLVGRFTY